MSDRDKGLKPLVRRSEKVNFIPMRYDDFTRWEKFYLRLYAAKENLSFRALRLFLRRRVAFGRGSRISPKLLRFRGCGKLQIGAGVCIDIGYHPVTFDTGPGSEIFVGDNTWIQSTIGATRFAADEGATIIVGKGCWFTGGHFGASERVTVGDNTLIGWGCSIIDSSLHDMDNFTPATKAPITIGSYVWLPNWITVMPGVTIGNHCVIGTGSLVTRDVPPNSFAAGRPAEVIRKIDDRDRAK